ncbi:MAG: hypothetical protein KF751_06260 [Nitrospira sp.]|nr:hypothetical protein [Nitrospira sp.]
MKKARALRSVESNGSATGVSRVEAIPHAMKVRPQWVMWKLEQRNGQFTKVPYRAKSGKKASVTNPQHWVTFAEAFHALGSGRYSGVGFVLTADDPFVGIDLDHCRDAETGVVEPWALALVNQLSSYTEISPSGTGLRIFVQGTLPPTGRKKGPLELYKDGRYLTITGNHVPGTPTSIEDRDAVLHQVHAAHFPSSDQQDTDARPPQPITADDDTQLVRMFESTHGEKIKKLWDGEWAGDYPSQSEADSALCFRLAYWFGRDPERMDRLFRRSQLMRDKWDSSRGDSTYGKDCIAHACEMTTETHQEAPTIVQEMNAQYAVVWMGGDCVILREHMAPDTGLLDVSFCTKAALKLFHAADPKIGEVDKVEYWLRHPAHRTYDSLVFQPGRTRCDPKFFNLWRGYAVKPIKGDCSLYLAHILNNICQGNKEMFLYVKAWLANVVQTPGNRPGVALVLRGKQGVGKGIFVKVLGSLFGRHFAHITNSHQLVGRFNAILKQAILVFADEAFWAGDKQAEGTLNALITEETHNIEPKGIDPFSVRNFMHLIVASNHEWVIPAASEARRWLVLDVGEDHLQDHAYFREISEQMKHGGREALLDELLHYDGSAVDLWTVPKTEALANQKVYSMTPVQKFWFNCLKAGSQIGSHWNRHSQFESGGFESGSSEWRTKVRTSELYDAYVVSAQQAGVVRRAMEMELADALKRMMPGATLGRIRIDGVQTRGWTFPQLEACRAAFDAYMNWTYQWNEATCDNLNDEVDSQKGLSRTSKSQPVTSKSTFSISKRKRRKKKY